MAKNRNIVVILNNIRSNENVGSIFRTADAAGVSKIYLCGYTPAPIDRFERVNKALAKSALGAEKSIEWEKVKTLSNAIKKSENYFFQSQLLRKSPSKNNFQILGIEQSTDSKNYKKYKYAENVALILGNEVTGLSKKDLEKCDAVVEIPMKGEKESLNVSVAAGVILFQLID